MIRRPQKHSPRPTTAACCGSLQRFYNIILTDCGTGLVHSAMAGVLDEADIILIVASPAVDSARSALATIDWLDRQGYSHLLPRATVVVSASRPGELGLDIDQLARHFLPRVRALHVIPFDDHLAEGSEVDLELLSRQPARPSSSCRPVSPTAS